MLSLLVVVLMAAFTACSESGKDAGKKISEESVYALVDKYDAGKMEEKDFAEAMEIFKTYNDLMMEEADKQLEKCKTDREFNKQMERFVARYTFVSELGYVFNATESQMGKENYANLMKMQQDFQTRMEKLQAKVDAKYYKNAAPSPAGMPMPEPETAAAVPAESVAAEAAPAPAPAN